MKLSRKLRLLGRMMPDAVAFESKWPHGEGPQLADLKKVVTITSPDPASPAEFS
jgi:hypothetical protein